jgi:hypothetical protein
VISGKEESSDGEDKSQDGTQTTADPQQVGTPPERHQEGLEKGVTPKKTRNERKKSGLDVLRKEMGCIPAAEVSCG